MFVCGRNFQGIWVIFWFFIVFGSVFSHFQSPFCLSSIGLKDNLNLNLNITCKLKSTKWNLKKFLELSDWLQLQVDGYNTLIGFSIRFSNISILVYHSCYFDITFETPEGYSKAILEESTYFQRMTYSLGHERYFDLVVKNVIIDDFHGNVSLCKLLTQFVIHMNFCLQKNFQKSQ